MLYVHILNIAKIVKLIHNVKNFIHIWLAQNGCILKY